MSTTRAKLRRAQKSLNKAKNILLQLEKSSAEASNETDIKAAQHKYRKADAELAEVIGDLETARAKRLKKKLEQMLHRTREAETKAERQNKKAQKALQVLQAMQNEVKGIEEKYSTYQGVANEAVKIAKEKKDLAKRSKKQQRNTVDSPNKGEVTNIARSKDDRETTSGAETKSAGRTAVEG